MQINFNPSVNQARLNFKARFSKDHQTEETLNGLIDWSPEKTLVMNYIIKDKIKGDDEISLWKSSWQYYVENNTTGTYSHFDFGAYRRCEEETPVDTFIRHIKWGIEDKPKYCGFNTTNKKCVHIDEATEAAYYDKARKFVAKLAPKQDRAITKLEQKKQVLEEQLRILSENLCNLKEERLKIVTEGIKKEIYKVAKEVK